MTYKHFLLDLDNTLYGYDLPHKTAMAKVLKSFSDDFGIDPQKAEEDFNLARKRTHLELPNRAASHNRLLYFQKLLEINELNSMPHALNYYHMYWDTFLEHMELFPNAENFLKNQKEQGHKTCLLTDLTAEIQYRKVERLGIGKYIDFIVTSEEVGVEKPHPTMFQKALSKLGCKAEEAIMIGDSWDKDILGASVLGIDSIWINHSNKQKEIPSNVSVVSRFEQISLK